MQVLVPSILTKPAPYSAQALAEFERFSGSSLPDVAALSGFGGRGCSANAASEGSAIANRTRRDFRIPPFIAACGSMPELADELDADRFAAAPDHFAAASGPGVARKRQPQFCRQRVGIVDRNLRSRRGQILHHALARGKTALERDPPGLTQGFARLALLVAR